MLMHWCRTWSCLRILAAAAVVAVVALPTPATADRGRAGLPAGSGNPLAALGAPSAAAPSGLALYDAVGTKVGEVIGLVDMSVPVVAFALPDSRYAALRAVADHLFGVRVVFEAPDCAGPPLLSAPFFDTPNALSTTMALAGVAGPGRTLYAAPLEAVAETVPVRSRLTVDGVCLTSAFASFASVVDAVPMVDLDALFSRPYRVR